MSDASPVQRNALDAPVLQQGAAQEAQPVLVDGVAVEQHAAQPLVQAEHARQQADVRRRRQLRSSERSRQTRQIRQIRQTRQTTRIRAPFYGNQVKQQRVRVRCSYCTIRRQTFPLLDEKNKTSSCVCRLLSTNLSILDVSAVPGFDKQGANTTAQA